MIELIVWIYASIFAPTLPEPVCEAEVYTREQREETRARVRSTCQSVGASEIVCDYLDAVVIRESSGRAGVRHTLGEGENGLGAMGLSIRWHRDKWPGEDEDPMFCHPEVSALVTLAIMRRAIVRYEAGDLTEIQAIFGGSWDCWGEGRDRMCRAHPRRTRDLCTRMTRRGWSCYRPVRLRDLGREVKRRDRRIYAARLVQKHRLMSVN